MLKLPHWAFGLKDCLLPDIIGIYLFIIYETRRHIAILMIANIMLANNVPERILGLILNTYNIIPFMNVNDDK